MDYYENPDLEWYKKISAKNKVLPRCPFTSVYKCPIYFQSEALLNRTYATELDENEEKKLIKYWKNSELNPSLLEEEPTVWYGDKRKIESVTNFCPEVTFHRFGYFVSYISECGDETDRAIRYNNLKKQNVKQDSWAWHWSSLRAEHYSDCRLYSILTSGKSIQERKSDNLTSKQLSDYEKYGYKCKDKIYIPGTRSIDRSNDIIVNENKIKIGDAIFLLFLRLVVELKKNRDGWISTNTLYKEHIIHDSGRYQKFSELNSRFRGSLVEKNHTDIIENHGSGEYRISTHPDFITYDKEKLLQHPIIKQKKSENIDKIDLVEISEVAKDLPDN